MKLLAKKIFVQKKTLHNKDTILGCYIGYSFY